MDLAQWVPLGAVIAWDAVWTQIAILQFINVEERLHKDYIESGSLDAAHSFIESQKLIPSLAEMFEAAQANNRPRSKIPIAVLLQSVDCIPYLERAEAAVREKKEIDDSLTVLGCSAGRLWKIGLAHVLLTILLWGSVVLAKSYPSLSWGPQVVASTPAATQAIASLANPSGKTFSQYASVTLTTSLAIAWAVSLGGIIYGMLRYHKRRAAFLRLLRVNRQVE
jgi:hypothetical protein